MAFIPVTDVAQITIDGRLDSQQTINDLYFQVSGGGITSVNLAALTNAVRTWVAGTWSVPLSDSWHGVRVVGIDLTAVNSFSVEVDASLVAGGEASEAAPNNVAACISLRTGVRGRSFRGRNYVPAVPNSQLTENTMSTDFMNNLINAYLALQGAGTFLAGWQAVAVSRYSGVNPITGRPIPRSSGIATPLINAIFTSPAVRSMRTREVGKGS